MSEKNYFEDREMRKNRIRNSRRRKIMMRNGLAIGAGCALLAGSFFGGAALFSHNSAQAATEIELNKRSEEATEEEVVYGLPDASGLVQKCLPSVVSITNVIELTTSNSGDGFYYDFFFYPGYNGRNQQPQTSTRETEAYGSGVIIGETDDELLLVTNNHVAVVDESGNSYFYSYTMSTKELKVTFSNGEEAPANLKGADAEADIAVIAIKKSDIPEGTLDEIAIAEVGNSDDLMIGNGVMAIGNALGRGLTATFGYVSALDRPVTTEDGYTRNLLQTDAAINEGNSGGGLFNAKGELVGINSSKTSGTGIESTGFSIPITTVEDLITDLMNERTKIAVEEERRGYLGIHGADVPASYYGIPEGAMVTQIIEGSPAETGGLHVGDIITAVGNQKISSFDELRSALSYYAADDTVDITIQRAAGTEYEEQVLSITLSSRDVIDDSVEDNTEAETSAE